MSTSTCPVLRPTMEEFKDFRKYIQKMEQDESIMAKGICKVIPPSGWFKRSYDLDKIDLTITNPVRQCVSGRAGIFEVHLFEVQSMTLKDIKNFGDRNSFESDSYPERERKFWRSLGVASNWDDPIYGADYVGTLFGADKACSWNVNDLDSILNLMGSEVPGVSNAMLYVGTWRAMFAFHVEDMNLYSINYVHSGASKSWYSIPLKYKSRFESMAESYFSEEHRGCHEFLRHKTKMFSPSQLKENGIEYNMVLQHEGEFVITFPGAYHAGFNHGFNIAEATNFATPKWIEMGRKARSCVCRPFSVRIDMDLLETLFLRQVNVAKNKWKDFKLAKRMRCACNKNPPLDDPSKPVSSDLIFCCAACSLYCHKQCIYVPPPPPEATTSGESAESSDAGAGVVTASAVSGKEAAAAVNLLCHICYSLENEGRWVPQESSSNSSGKESNGLSTAPASSSSSSTSAVATASAAPASSKAQKRIREKVQFKISDVIALGTPGVDEIVGIIMDLEDGLARLHQRKTKREDDIWITLGEHCRLLQRDGVSLVAAPEPPLAPLGPGPSSKKVATSAASEFPSAPPSQLFQLDKVTSIAYPDEIFEKQRMRLSNMLQKMTPAEFKKISTVIFQLCKLGTHGDSSLAPTTVTTMLNSLESTSPNREVIFSPAPLFVVYNHTSPISLLSPPSLFSSSCISPNPVQSFPKRRTKFGACGRSCSGSWPWPFRLDPSLSPLNEQQV